MRLLTTQSKVPGTYLIAAAIIIAGAVATDFMAQAETLRAIPVSAPRQLIVAPVAQQIRPIVAPRVAGAKPSVVAAKAVPVDPVTVAGTSAPAIAPVAAAVAKNAAVAKPAARAQKIAVYTCRLGQDYSLKLQRCVPEASQPGQAVSPTSSMTGTGVTVVMPPSAVAGKAMAKQAEPGILSAMQAAQQKTVAQVGKVKRVLAPDSRMSLGLAPQKK